MVALSCLYTIGALIFLSRLGRGWLLVAGLLRRARSGGPVAIGSAGDGIVYQSPEVAAPLTAGVVRPMVILPSAWTAWTPEVLSAVVAHEMAHVGRRDALVLLLARFNRAVLWFHPLSWWLERQLAITAEHACDEVASAAVPRTAPLCGGGVEMADAVRHHSGRVAWRAVAAWMVPGILEGRIDRVLRGGFARTSRARAAATMLSCAAAIMLIAACASRSMRHLSAKIPISPGASRRSSIRNEIGRAALDLSKEQVAALEEALLKNPMDLDTRYKVLEFYQASGKVTTEEDACAAAPRAVADRDSATGGVGDHCASDQPGSRSRRRATRPRGLAAAPRSASMEYTDISRAAWFFDSYDPAYAEELLLPDGRWIRTQRRSMPAVTPTSTRHGPLGWDLFRVGDHQPRQSGVARHRSGDGAILRGQSAPGAGFEPAPSCSRARRAPDGARTSSEATV